MDAALDRHSHPRRHLWLVAMLLMLPSLAHADDREAARQAFRRGSQHYKLGEYKEALVDFKQAFRSHEDPSFIYNIAQCERQLEMREDAVREYRMYLAESPEAPNRDEVRGFIAALEQQIEAERVRREREAAAHQPELQAQPQPTQQQQTQAQPNPLIASAPPKKTPAYKKWWVWTLAGVAIAGGAAAGLAVGLTRVGPAPAASTSLGTAHPFN